MPSGIAAWGAVAGGVRRQLRKSEHRFQLLKRGNVGVGMVVRALKKVVDLQQVRHIDHGGPLQTQPGKVGSEVSSQRLLGGDDIAEIHRGIAAAETIVDRLVNAYLVLGLLQSLSAAYLPALLVDAMIFSLLFVILMVRPDGLFVQSISESPTRRV